MINLVFIFSFFYTVFSQKSLRGSKQDIIKEEDIHWKEFTIFQQRFSKKYTSLKELEDRFTIFKNNFIDIINHNSNVNQNYTLGVNQFTDLTQDEFKSFYLSGFNNNKLESFGCKSFSYHSDNLADSFDWRLEGVVNPVRDQGQCGSCWAFATTANAESVWALSSGELLDLSEEYLVDCASGKGFFNMGCNGGNPDSAFKYMIQTGQCTELSYPYKAGLTKNAGTCQVCSPAPVQFSSCSDVKPNDQLALKNAVSQQPVVVAIEADTRIFQSYSSGVIDSVSCGTNLDHAVEIVGYGEENGKKYWTVRNSWSTSWGLGGYVLIERSDSANDVGICGIASQPSFLSA
jgi:C1A family cysteine protease